MKKLINSCRDLYKRETPLRLEWLLVLLVLIVSYFTMYYTDISITYEHSLNLLESIFSGNFLGFYDYAYVHSEFGTGAYYELPIYVVFAIWGLPVYILSKLFGLSWFCVGVRLWFKLIPVIGVLLSVKGIKLVAKELNINEKLQKWIPLFFLSSLIVVIPAFQVAQYDSIYLFLILFGIYYYLKGNHKLFLLCFAIAVPMKLFSMMIFIPLVLLKEKRILYIIKDMLISIGFLLVCKLLFHNSLAYSYLDKFVEQMSTMLKFTPINITNNVAVLFYTGFALICIWAYSINLDEVKDKNSYILISAVASMLNLFLFTSGYPYWIILLAPFIILLTFYHNEKLRINLILELVLSCCFTYMNIMNFPTVYGSHNAFSALILSQTSWLEERLLLNVDSSTATMLSAYGLGDLRVMVASFILACSIGFLYVNYPRKDVVLKSDIFYMERGMVWLRLMALAGWTGFVFIAVL